MKKILAHMGDPITSLCNKRKDVPTEIDCIFQEMVAKKPVDRYQQTTQFVAAFEAWCNLDTTAAFTRPMMPEQDSRLTDLFRTVRTTDGPAKGAGVSQLVKTPTRIVPEQTLARLGPEIETDPQSESIVPIARAAGAKTQANRRGGCGKPPFKLIAGGIGGFALLVLLGIWVIVKDKDGNEVARVKLPEGGNVVTQNESNTKPMPQSTPATTTSARPQPAIPPAKAFTPAPKPTPIGPQPPAAVAPFDAETARSHQVAWAKHLGIKVEMPNRVGQTMILLPPGEFLMGSTDDQVETASKVAEEIKSDQQTKDRIQKNERPQHKVVITKPLLMSATEVTIGQFQKFAAATGYQTEAEKAEAATKAAPPSGEAGQPPSKPIQTYLNPGYVASEDLPAAFITWNDATAYCEWLSLKEKAVYRLPTEAEWEYACRAGTTTQYSFGDDYNELPKYGWYSKNAGGKPHPVGMLLPNPFGLFDMHGNLYEWCGDYFDEKWYSTSSSNDPIGPSVGSNRVRRGGNWDNSVSNCRSAYRSNYTPSTRVYSSGFRCVLEW